MPQLWDAEDILDLYNDNRCVGYAPSKKRKCMMPIRYENAQCCNSILDDMSNRAPDPVLLSTQLRNLAQHGLCVRYHQNQVDAMVQKWSAKIQAAYPTRQRHPSLRQLEDWIQDRSVLVLDRDSRWGRCPLPSSYASSSRSSTVRREPISPPPVRRLTYISTTARDVSPRPTRRIEYTTTTPQEVASTSTPRTPTRSPRVTAPISTPRASTHRSSAITPPSTPQAPTRSSQVTAPAQTLQALVESPNVTAPAPSPSASTLRPSVNTPPSTPQAPTRSSHVTAPAPAPRASTPSPRVNTPPPTPRAPTQSPGVTAPTPCTHARRLPVDEECAVCHDDETMDERDDSELRWCKSSCGRSVHRECFDVWAASCVQGGRVVTCIHCRGKWQESELLVLLPA